MGCRAANRPKRPQSVERMRRLATLLLLLFCAQAHGAWQTQTEADPMGRGVRTWTATLSVNRLNFGFPYRGGSRGRLTLRRGPTQVNPTDVMLEISRGQFLCGIDGCSIAARFDEDAVIEFKADSPSDGSSDTLFIKPPQDFVERLKTARKLKIEAEYFQAGRRVLEFNAGGLKWD